MKTKIIYSIIMMTFMTTAHADELSQKAKAVIEKGCFRCHGEPGKKVRGGVDYILNVAKLIENKKVIPGDSKNSPLFTLMDQGEMPPEGSEPRPSADDIKVIQEWIDSGAKDWTHSVDSDDENPSTPTQGPTPAPSGDGPLAFISDRRLLRTVENDLKNLPTEMRTHVRYFSLLHLKDYRGLDLNLQRAAFIKLVNSLSWKSTLVQPAAIDPDQLVYRVDLRRLGWTSVQWDTLKKADPYLGGLSAEYKGHRSFGAQEKVVRMDWFSANASRPPLYYVLLDLPKSDLDLERRLGVNITSNIQHGRAMRAGFTQSGVAVHSNRVIERHDSSFRGIPGVYWKGYDFRSSNGRGNIFANPLGPGNGPLAFEHAGGEIIFSLPNGLHAYYLSDAKGNRLDIAPTDIVADPNRSRGVENGVSCFSCHSNGFIYKKDEIRTATIARAHHLPEPIVQKVLMLYVEEDKFKEKMDEDNKRFRGALQTLNLPTFTRPQTPSTEIINISTDDFERDVTLPRAAMELGLAENLLSDSILSDESAQALAGSLVTAGFMRRDAFLEVYRILRAPFDHPEDRELHDADLKQRVVRLRNLLFKSVRDGDLSNVERLTRLGVDLNERNNVGSTPLIEAVISKQEKVVAWLLQQSSVNRNLKDYFGRTAFDWASVQGSEQIKKLFN